MSVFWKLYWFDNDDDYEKPGILPNACDFVISLLLLVTISLYLRAEGGLTAIGVVVVAIVEWALLSVASWDSINLDFPPEFSYIARLLLFSKSSSS